MKAMSVKPVTTAQLEQVRKMAREKGVSREQFQNGLDNGTLATALNAMKQGTRITLLPIVEPPPGGRIHTVRVPVVLDRSWPEAVRAAGPDIPDSDSVWRVEDFYLRTGSGQVEQEVVLLNFGSKGGNWNKAQAWAKHYALKQSVSRQVLAIGEHKSELHRKLGMDPLCVVATKEFSFVGRRRACGVWWSGARRGAGLVWVSDCGRAPVWFAFVCESA